jgi:hypothetical protein
MSPESREAPTFSSRSFDISLYRRKASGDTGVKIFEGQTLTISRTGLRATVNNIGTSVNGMKEKSFEEHWLNTNVLTKFHAISSALNEKRGKIVDILESDNARYRWAVEVSFESELNLLEMQLGVPD